MERLIAASPDTVWSYLVDPARFSLWMVARAELDPRRGGAYRLDIEGGGVALGKYLEVDAPNRLIFTWGWENHLAMPPGSSRVEITLEEEGAATLLRLRHLGLPDEEARHSHSEGWSTYIQRLGALFGVMPDAG